MYLAVHTLGKGMHAYTELIKPSVVTHLQLLPGRKNGEILLFIVRGGSLLQVYEIIGQESPRWLADFPLQGQVAGMGQLNDSDLLVALVPSKMVVLNFNYALRQLETKSMHYYERAAANHPNFGTGADHEYKLSVDPLSSNVLFWFQPQLAACVQPKTPDPLYSVAKDCDLQSDLFSPHGLATNLGVAAIIDLEYLSSFSEPTLAVLAAECANWAGLAAVRGEITNSLYLLAQKQAFSHTDLKFKSSVVAKTMGLSCSFSRVKSLRDNEANVIAILIGSNSLGLLTIDMEVCEILQNIDGLCFDNCVIEQMGRSAGVLIGLQSGRQILLDIKHKGFSDIQSPPDMKLLLPTAISSCGGVLAIASKLSGVSLYTYEAQAMSKPGGHRDHTGPDSIVDLVTIENIQQLYASPPQSPPLTSPSAVAAADAAAPQGASALNVEIDHKSHLKSFGPLSSITRIDNGLACATDSGIIIVEQKLKLDIYDKFRPQLELEVGEFWLLDQNERHILIANAIPEAQTDRSNSENKRRKTEVAPRKFDFRDVSHSEEGESVKIPEQLDLSEPIVSVLNGPDSLYVVQPHQLIKLDSADWIFQAKHTFPARTRAISAELSGDNLLIRFENSSSVFRCTNLEHLNLDAATAGSSISSLSPHYFAAVDSKQGLLKLNSLSGQSEDLQFDINDLGACLKPIQLSDKSSPESGNLSEVVSVYLLKYGTTEFLGIHSDRLFAVYEITDESNLIKRYTIPFAVNRSPVWLPNTELLVFPSRKPHALVKSDITAFECVQLNIPSEKMVDIVQYTDTKFVFLDDTDKLHYCMLYPEIDYMSNSLPFQHIQLPDSNFTPTHVVFNDDTGTIIVGANEWVPLPPKDEAEQENEQEIEENKVEAPDASVVDEDVEEVEDISKEMTEEEETEKEAFPSHRGRIFAMSLFSRKFQESVVELDETLLSLQILYPAAKFEKSPKQVLAVGTSKDDVETQQTNGHIRLYGIREEPVEYVEDDYEEEFDLVFNEYAHELLRGPVSGIYELMDFVLVAHGQQIKVFDYVQGLVPVGFFQTHPYMQDLKCIRNIVVLGERLHTPRLVNFALQPRRMDLLASADSLTRGNGFSPICAVETVSSEERGDLAVVSTTEDGRIQLFMFDPENPESSGGSRLVPHRSFYTGHRCVSLCQSETGDSEDLIAFGATADGCVFSVRPLNETQFRALYLLTQQMIEKEPNSANLNPRMHRSCFEPHTAAGAGAGTSSSETPASQLIDINLAQRFWGLSRSKQSVYTRSLGYDGLRKVQTALNSEGRNPVRM